MELTQQRQQEIIQAYKSFWVANLSADMERFASYLVDDFCIFGSANGEVFYNRKDAVAFYAATAEELKDKAELRNRAISVQPVEENSAVILEICDLYVLLGTDWTFYGHARISCVMKKFSNEWKALHQHVSFPDHRTEEGQQLAAEKIEKENLELREAVKRRTVELEAARKKAEDTLQTLKATQQQLIHAEKMASLGELTAGIAHEIQNPLNFVNNFSEVSRELIDELKNQKSTLTIEEQEELLNDIDSNLEKINHHGKRADGIVKGMLQHSRKGGEIKEPSDINALCDEYLKLSYHGLRAKDKTFNAVLNTDFDSGIGKVDIVPQDIGRVLLNLYNNAFYATAEKKKSAGAGYEPMVSVATRAMKVSPGGRKLEITVTDNGSGIPASIIDKIFQPFFTSKPTGEGTGLGLSLAYDIVTKGHGGEIKAESNDGEGTVFTILIPMT